jgi:predicted amidohydrolase YtcJ
VILLLQACAPSDPADLVFRGGPVYTMTAEDARALAVAGDRIVWVGVDPSGRIGPDTEIVELDGRALFPGFIDAHTHPAMSGAEALDVSLYDAGTLTQLLAAVSAWAAANPESAWVRGGGWDVSLFNDSLDKSQLDGVVADRPAFLSSADGHSAWVNSAALAAAGVSDTTPDPEDGEIERDANGEATGVLREAAADVVGDLMPGWAASQVDAGTADGLAEAASFGLTSLVDANADEDLLAAYRRADDAGTLTARVFAAVEVEPGFAAEGVGELQDLADRYAGGGLSVNAGKMYVDGVIESQTAAMLEPYEDGTNGELCFTDQELADSAVALDAAGFQLHFHAIGDGAVRQALDAVAAAESANGPADRRPLLAHLEVIDPADAVRFAESGALADFQPLWAYPDPYITDWTLPFIGDERAALLYPMRSVLAAGGTLVAGSDWSVSTMNPWEAIEVAVTRQDPAGGGGTLNADEAVSLEDAVAAYTRDGALAIFAEGELGTLEAGKLADLVLVDRDPFGIDPTDLSNVVVQGTWAGGRRVFER